MLQLYVVGSVFYTFKSGLPQPADILLLLGIVLSAILYFTRSENNGIKNFALYGFLFGIYALCVNVINYFFIPDKTFLFSGLYYIFNFMAFLFFLSVASRTPRAFQNGFYRVLAAVIIFETIYVLFLTDQVHGRPTGTFNNPNQLSYWALLSFCILIGLRYPARFKPLDYALIAMLLLISALSLSKGGMIAFLFLLFCILCTKLIGPVMRYALLIGLLFMGLYALSDDSSVHRAALEVEEISNVVERFANIGKERDDSAAQRGYFRMIHNPEYLILGAGEGGYERFHDFPYEFHSGVGTLVFSYGLVGTLFFSLFLFHIYKRLPPIFWCMLFALFLYGLTHQNIRFTYFWVFLAVCQCAHYNIAARREPYSTSHNQPEPTPREGSSAPKNSASETPPS